MGAFKSIILQASHSFYNDIAAIHKLVCHVDFPRPATFSSMQDSGFKWIRLAPVPTTRQWQYVYPFWRSIDVGLSLMNTNVPCLFEIQWKTKSYFPPCTNIDRMNEEKRASFDMQSSSHPRRSGVLTCSRSYNRQSWILFGKTCAPIHTSEVLHALLTHCVADSCCSDT